MKVGKEIITSGRTQGTLVILVALLSLAVIGEVFVTLGLNTNYHVSPQVSKTGEMKFQR